VNQVTRASDFSALHAIQVLTAPCATFERAADWRFLSRNIRLWIGLGISFAFDGESTSDTLAPLLQFESSKCCDSGLHPNIALDVAVHKRRAHFSLCCLHCSAFSFPTSWNTESTCGILAGCLLY